MKVSVVLLLVVIGVVSTFAEEQTGRASNYNKYYSKPSLKNKYQKTETEESSFSIMKIIFKFFNYFMNPGNKSDSSSGSDDSGAATRQIFNLVMTAFDYLQNTFQQRSSSYKARGTSSSIDDGVLAALHIFKGAFKASMSTNAICIQRYLCNANQLAAKSGSVGHILSRVATPMAGKILGSTEEDYAKLNAAARRGRSGDNCEVYYNQCNETE